MEKTYKSNSSLFFRFQNAVEDLAIGEEDIRTRLAKAYHFVYPIFQDRDLPEKFRVEWIEFTEIIKKFSSDGNVAFGDIGKETIIKMAQLLFNIFVYLAYEQE